MSEFYQDMQAIASDLLREFKQGELQYVAMIPGNGTIDNPGTPTPVTYNLTGVARGVSQRYVDGTNIVASDLQTTVSVDVIPIDVSFSNGSLWENLSMWSSASTKPDISGFVQMDGKRFKVVKVMQIPPAGTPVAFVLIFRK